jgi:hypothetical protein
MALSLCLFENDYKVMQCDFKSVNQDVMLKVAIMWNKVSCSIQRFWVKYHLPLQGRESTEQETSWPWIWRWYIPPKCWFIYRLHDTISQKMATFIITTERTSNPTRYLVTLGFLHLQFSIFNAKIICIHVFLLLCFLFIHLYCITCRT